MIIKVQYGQSLMDVAIQQYGSASALVDLANDNSLALDAEIQPGQLLSIRDEYPDAAESIFADYMTESKIIVVSGEQTTVEILITNDGEAISTNDDDGFGL